MDHHELIFHPFSVSNLYCFSTGPSVKLFFPWFGEAQLPQVWSTSCHAIHMNAVSGHTSLWLENRAAIPGWVYYQLFTLSSRWSEDREVTTACNYLFPHESVRQTGGCWAPVAQPLQLFVYHQTKYQTGGCWASASILCMWMMPFIMMPRCRLMHTHGSPWTNLSPRVGLLLNCLLCLAGDQRTKKLP